MLACLQERGVFFVCLFCGFLLSNISMINSPSVSHAAQFYSYPVSFYKVNVRITIYLGCVNPAGLNLEKSW